MTPTPDTAAPRGADASELADVENRIALWSEGMKTNDPMGYIALLDRREKLRKAVDAPAAAVEAGAGEAGGWSEDYNEAMVRQNLDAILARPEVSASKAADIRNEADVWRRTAERVAGGHFADAMYAPPGATPTDAAPPARVTEKQVNDAVVTFQSQPVVPTSMAIHRCMRAALEAFVAARGAGHD